MTYGWNGIGGHYIHIPKNITPRELLTLLEKGFGSLLDTPIHSLDRDDPDPVDDYGLTTINTVKIYVGDDGLEVTFY